MVEVRVSEADHVPDLLRVSAEHCSLGFSIVFPDPVFRLLNGSEVLYQLVEENPLVVLSVPFCRPSDQELYHRCFPPFCFFQNLRPFQLQRTCQICAVCPVREAAPEAVFEVVLFGTFLAPAPILTFLHSPRTHLRSGLSGRVPADSLPERSLGLLPFCILVTSDVNFRPTPTSFFVRFFPSPRVCGGERPPGANVAAMQHVLHFCNISPNLPFFTFLYRPLPLFIVLYRSLPFFTAVYFSLQRFIFPLPFFTGQALSSFTVLYTSTVFL